MNGFSTGIAGWCKQAGALSISSLNSNTHQILDGGRLLLYGN